MRSYLSIIAARAVHQPQSIRPQVGSLFESPGSRMRILEPIAKKQVVQPQRASESGNEQSKAASLIENIAGRETGPQSSYTEIRPAAFEMIRRVANLQPKIKPISEQTTPRPVRVASRQEETNRKRTEDERKVETLDQKEDRSHPAAIRSELARDEPPVMEIIEETNVIESAPEPAVPGPMTATSKLHREPPFHAGVIVRSELAASEGKTPTFEVPLPSQEAPQSIRITIGRVDVRAIMPQTPTATNQVRKAATTEPMSLEEYLNKRNGA